MLRILVVDANEANRERIKGHLSIAYEVAKADSPKDALRWTLDLAVGVEPTESKRAASRFSNR